jgi:hypothetical protein
MTAIRRPPWLLSLALLTLVVVAAAGSLAASPTTADWPAPRHDSSNTGFNPTVVAPTTDVGVGWTARVGTGGWGDVGPTDLRLYALVEGGSAVPGSLLGQFGDAIVSDAFLGALAAIGAASLVAGVVAGGVVLGVARALGFSWVTPRLLAARLLRRPYEAVGRRAVVGVHFLLAVLVLVVAGAVYLGGSILLSVFGPSGPSLLGGGLPIVGGLLLLGAIAAWAVFAYRWLPSASAVEDVSIRTLRRQAAVVLVTYAVVAGVLYPLLLFVSLMLVFFR